MRYVIMAMIGVLYFCALSVDDCDASPVRIIVECAELGEGPPNDEIIGCVRPRHYFDLGIRFGGLTFKLERPRQILAGFDAGTGYGYRWLPDFWTLSGAFLSADLFVNAGYLAREAIDDAVQLGLLAVVSFANLFGIGAGYQWLLGFGDAPDMRGWIGTVGVATSF